MPVQSKVARQTPQPNVEEIRRAIEGLFRPGDVVEVRAFKSRRCTISGYYADFDKLATDAAKINRVAGGVYIVLNQIDPALLARRANRCEEYASTTTSDDQVIRRRWLPIDLDAERPAGISASDKEHDAAIAKARKVRTHLVDDLGWPEPVAADSGNGAHLLFALDMPNDVESGLLVQNVLAALDAKFSDDTIHVDKGIYNASRILKLYGTVAGKGDHTEDRPHRLSKLLNVPEVVEVVPVEKLRALADQAPQPERPQNDYRSPYQDNGQRLDVAAWLRQHGIAVLYDDAYSGRMGGRKWVLSQCVWDPEHTDKSAFIIQAGSGAISAGCQHNSCQGKGWHDLRDAVEPGWRDRRKVGQGDVHQGEPGDAPPGGDQTETIVFPSLTAAELDMEEYQVDWLIPGLLAGGQHCIGGGPHKSLKSLVLACDLGLSLATGGHFCGYWPVPEPVPTAIMSGECGYPVVQDYLRRIARAAGKELRHVGNLLVSDHLPQFGRLDHSEAMGKYIQDNGLQVVIVDPLYLALPGSVEAANLFSMGAVLRGMAEVFVAHNATMILLHHSTKPAGRDGGPIDLADLQFSGFAQFAAQWLLLSRRARYVPGTGYHELWFSAGGRAGHSGLWGLNVDEGEFHPGIERKWDVSVLTPEEARSEVGERRDEAKEEAREQRLEENKQRIINAAAKYPDGETKSTLRDASGIHPREFSVALAGVLSDGDLVPHEIRKNNRTWEAYRLREEPPE